MWSIFSYFEIIIFFFAVDICDLVNHVEAIAGLCKLSIASGNHFCYMCHARETAICITHILEKISRYC